MYISRDEKELIVINRKPVSLAKRVFETNEEELRRLDSELKNKKRSEADRIEEDYCPTELDEDLDNIEFMESRSSASCKIDDIQGIIFGGQSSRFWMLRKHISSQHLRKKDKMPFYSWNCLTLQLKHRDVDLVIRNESHMKMLIRFLIFRLKTIDGQKGSAIPILEEIRSRVPPMKFREAEESIYNQVCFRYTMLMIRHKISFSAFSKKMAIHELLIRTIQTSYRVFVQEGLFKVDPTLEKIYDQMIPKEITN